MKSPQAAKRFFLALLLGSAVLLAFVLYPLAEALFMATALAGVLWTLNGKLAKKLGNRRGLAAGIIVAGVVVLVLGPIVGLSTYVYREAGAGVKFVSDTVKGDGLQGLLAKLPEPMQKLGARIVEQLPTNAAGALDQESVGKTVSEQGGKAAALFGRALGATGSLLFKITMMLIALYFLLLQGEQLVAWLDEASPLLVGQTEELLAEFKKVSYAVIVSTVITSAVQAAAALVGYLIARVPYAFFFAAVTFFFAFIPAIGAGAICVAAALLLYITGHPYLAIFLAVWGLFVVGLIDNVVRPLLIKGDMETNGALVFFSLLGGLAVFGAVGLLVGPVVLAAFLALMRMYRRDFSTAGPKPGGPAPAAAVAPKVEPHQAG